MLIALGACQVNRTPDLQRLYGVDRDDRQHPPPVVLIHGTLGSKLRRKDSGEEVWFGNLSKLLFSNYTELAMDINADELTAASSALEVSQIADQISGWSLYDNIITTLTEHAGYRLTALKDPLETGPRRLYIFTYDWRQDNVVSAQKLGAFIEAIRAQHNDPDLRVDVIAHSMGGLIARYYMRYGGVDVLTQAPLSEPVSPPGSIRRAILLGTPNLGSTVTVNRLVNGYSFNIRNIPVEVLITMPSIFQLLPFGEDWLIDLQGQTVKLNAFDAATWQQFEWSIFNPQIQEKIIARSDSDEDGARKLDLLKKFFIHNLARAREFLWSINRPLEGINHGLFVMGGDCDPTLDRLVLEKFGDAYHLRAQPHEIRQKINGIDYETLMYAPGDGLVTKKSLLAEDASLQFPLKYPLLLCQSHSRLTSNIHFQDNLLNILLFPKAF